MGLLGGTQRDKCVWLREGIASTGWEAGRHLYFRQFILDLKTVVFKNKEESGWIAMLNMANFLLQIVIPIHNMLPSSPKLLILFNNKNTK